MIFLARIKNFLRPLRNSLLFYRYRRALAIAGGVIQPKASVFGAAGIKIDSGSFVFRGATLAATHLAPNDSFVSPPQGSITIGKRCIIHQQAILASYGGRIVIGDDVSINPGVIIYGHGGVTIGKYTRIAAYAVMVPANHRFEDPTIPIMQQGLSCVGIAIGDDVWIGTKATILDGVTVGTGAVVAAGAVVTRDVAAYEIVGGIPARTLGYRKNDQEVKKCSSI